MARARQIVVQQADCPPHSHRVENGTTSTARRIDVEHGEVVIETGEA
jgi:hypothetical protein